MKNVLFVISAIAVISTTASLWFFIEKEEAKQSYQELERTLGLENSFLKRTLSEVSTERDQLKAKADQLNNEIIQAKQEKLEAVAKLNTAVQIQKDLEGKIAALEGEKQIFEAQIKDQKLRIARLQSKALTPSSSQFTERRTIESLQKELERIKRERGALEQKLAAASQGQRIEPIGRTVELPPIMISSPVAGSQTPLLNATPSYGEILTVNEDHQFVVIGLGEKDGVVPGMKFKVLRGGEEVGAVEVIETRPHIAAADIKETRTARLQSDDQVLLSQR